MKSYKTRGECCSFESIITTFQVKTFLHYRIAAVEKFLLKIYLKLKVLSNFSNGCYFEMKKGFDLKFFMAMDPNKNNIHPTFIIFDQSVEKLLFLSLI
jgi:hypothetical protein